MIGFALLGFWSYHMYLVLRNKTTNEVLGLGPRLGLGLRFGLGMGLGLGVRLRVPNRVPIPKL